MNERIRELATQAREYTEKYNSERGNKLIAEEWTEVYNEKFAELIVRECVDVAIEQKKLAQQPVFNPQDITWDRARIQQSDLIIHKIKQHFGVEE